LCSKYINFGHIESQCPTIAAWRPKDVNASKSSTQPLSDEDPAMPGAGLVKGSGVLNLHSHMKQVSVVSVPAGMVSVHTVVDVLDK